MYTSYRARVAFETEDGGYLEAYKDGTKAWTILQKPDKWAEAYACKVADRAITNAEQSITDAVDEIAKNLKPLSERYKR